MKFDVRIGTMNKLIGYIKHLEILKEADDKTEEGANDAIISGYQVHEQNMKQPNPKKQKENPWNVQWTIDKPFR